MEISEPAPSQETAENETLTPSQPKIPTITLDYSPAFLELMAQISELCKEKICAKVIGNLARISPNTEEQFLSITQFLKSGDIDFYITQHKSHWPQKLVIRGLPINTPIDDIATALNELGYTVLRTSQMMKYYKDKEMRSKMPLFKVSIQRDSNLPELTSVTNLLYFNVTIEKFRGSGKIPQCHRCLRFGHDSSICNFKPRCLKCANYHFSSECPLGKRVDTPKCAICNAEGHTAIYYLCPKRPKAKPKKSAMTESKKRQPKKEPRSNKNPQLLNLVTSKDPKPKTYASVSALPPSASQDTSATNNSKPPENTALMPHSQENSPISEFILFKELIQLWKEISQHVDLFNLIQGLRKISANLKSASDPTERLLILSEIFAFL